MTDNTIHVSYKWKHLNHDPANFEEYTKSRLPVELKEWIMKNVEQDLDWKQIKNLLRLDEARLDEVSCFYFFFGPSPPKYYR